MTKEQFKVRWESDDNGGGITFDDIAACAVAWGVCARPRIQPVQRVLKLVLVAAGVLSTEG